MCQINGTPIGDGPVIGYRIYERGPRNKRELSYFNGYARPDLNVKIAAENEPFHACQSIEDVKSMLAYCNGERDHVVVYRCELSDDVQSGVWSDTQWADNPIKTYTAKFCTLLEVTKDIFGETTKDVFGKEVQLQPSGNQAT